MHPSGKGTGKRSGECRELRLALRVECRVNVGEWSQVFTLTYIAFCLLYILTFLANVSNMTYSALLLYWPVLLFKNLV